MKVYAVNCEEGYKCPGCNWHITIGYVLASSPDEAQEETPLCAHCLCEELAGGYIVMPDGDRER